MSNGIIEIKENDMNEIYSHLKKNSNKIIGASNAIGTSMAKITKTGLLKNGTAKIKNQMNAIGEGIESMGNSVIKQYESMERVETSLKSKAESINIPMDFVKNDTSRNVDINAGKLKKDDGKAVNADDNTKTEELKFDSVIDYNENLKYIVKEYEDKNHEIVLNGDKTLLKNIKNERNIDIDDKLDDSIIIKKDTKNIKKESNIDINSDLEDTDVKKKYIKSIEGNLEEMTAKINLELDVGRVNLTKLNLSNFQISDDNINYTINKQRLTSINK